MHNVFGDDNVKKVKNRAGKLTGVWEAARLQC